MTLNTKAAYTDVQYITTSAANQNWVLLDYTPKANTILEATVEIPASSYGNTHTLFCARGKDAADHPFVCFISSAKNWRFDFNENGVNKQGGAYDADTKYLVRAEASGFYVDNVKVVTPSSVPSGFEAANKLVLFASYMSTSSAVDPVASGGWAEIKVYGVRIWDGAQTEENLKYDLRPCMDGNGVYCLRDAKNPDHAPYYSEGDNDFGGSSGLLSVSVEDYVTCVPHVSLTGLDVPDVTSVEFQSGRTAEGPWTTFATVAAPEGGVVAADYADAIVGIPLYYRAVVHADTSMASSVVPFTRFRRLERDPAKESGGFVNGYVQIMEKYAMDVYKIRMPLAFDGKTDTYPDSVLSDGDQAKVGIDFGEAGVFFAGGRVYPRSNSFNRSNGAYFSAANDASFADEVAVSGTVNFNNLADWRFIPSTDVVHPYRYVWMWKPAGNWYANMSEVQFYGWTQQDIDNAGVVVAPQEVTTVRGVVPGSIVVGWSGGANIASLAIERRIAGTDAWTTAVDGLPATATSWTDTSLALGVSYEYRILATGTHGDSMVSASSLTFLYRVGDGTGLRAVLQGPIASPSYANRAAGQCAYREFRNDATIDINTALSSETLYAQTNIASALVHWRGKLIVPEDGDYTLGFEVKGSDGYSIWVDNEEVANHNCRAGKERVGLSLTVGEHPIRIEWASRANGYVRFCRLTWACAGKFAEEVIPMTQLKPETDDSVFPCYAVDGYNFALPLNYDADIYLPRMERTANGDYTIYCQANDLVVSEPDIGMTMKGPFRAEVTLNAADSTRSPRPQLAVRRVSDGRAMIGFISAGGSGNVNVKAANASLNSMNDVTSWFACKSPVRLRIDRDRDKTLHFYYKGDGQTKWTECFTFIEGTHYIKDGVKKTDRATLTDESIRVSFAAAGGVGTSYRPIDCHSHDFTVKPRLSGMILVVK